MTDLVLVGCVKSQLPSAAPAEDLFTSPLWRGRRRHAIASGKPWWVLSSRHGLVHPDEVITPYDLPFGAQSVARRTAWGVEVVGRLAPHVTAGQVVEVHAGAAVVKAIAAPLTDLGLRLVTPLEGLAQGQQLAWYAACGTPLGSSDPGLDT